MDAKLLFQNHQHNVTRKALNQKDKLVVTSYDCMNGEKCYMKECIFLFKIYKPSS